METALLRAPSYIYIYISLYSALESLARKIKTHPREYFLYSLLQLKIDFLLVDLWDRQIYIFFLYNASDKYSEIELINVMHPLFPKKRAETDTRREEKVSPGQMPIFDRQTITKTSTLIYPAINNSTYSCKKRSANNRLRLRIYIYIYTLNYWELRKVSLTTIVSRILLPWVYNNRKIRLRVLVQLPNRFRSINAFSHQIHTHRHDHTYDRVDGLLEEERERETGPELIH